MNRPGDRVGAIFSAKGDDVYFLGYGEYLGDKDISSPPEGVPRPAGATTEIILQVVAEIGGEFPNPLIKLDSGKHVWGCECWWGPEAEVRRRLEGATIHEIDIDAERAKVASEGHEP